MKSGQGNRKAYIRMLMDKTPATRNQIASISGLSNPYIKELEEGNIINVGREKLLALSIALDLSLTEIDDLLTVFERSKLSVGDIPLFLNTAERLRLSAAMHPINDSYALDLMFLAAEIERGPHIIVSTRPASCFRHENHRLYAEKPLVEAHPIYGDLVSAINRERRRRFLINLEANTAENYVCVHCLEDYIRRCDDEEERTWRLRHLQSVIEVIESYPNFKFFLTKECPSFLFVMKSASSSENDVGRLIITAFAQHRFTTKTSASLTGFATENKAVITNFRNELNFIRGSVLTEFKDRKRLSAHLRDLAAASCL